MKIRLYPFALSILLTQFFFSSPLIAQRAHFGLWLDNADSSHMAMNLSWSEFQRENQYINSYHLQLKDIETYIQNGKRVFTGVWERSDDTTVLVQSPSYEDFYQSWEELSENNLRLVDIETYREGSERKYLAVYHKGDEPYAFVGKTSWKGLNSLWVEKFRQDLRMVDFEMYKDGENYTFMGVWRYGTYGQMFWGGTDWYGFTQKIEELKRPGLNLTDVETFSDGSSRKYIGIWNQDSTRHYLWNGVDRESFEAKWQQINGSRFSLVDFEQYPGCELGCDNQVVSQSSFSLKLRGHKEIYYPPTTSENGHEYIDFNAINFSGRFLYLPFSEGIPAELAKTWVDDGNWTYGLTYKHETDQSFRVRAMAEGTVIFANWEPNYGNTIVISHDYRGQKDAFRTIYTNLRNTPEQDCRLSWDYSVKYMKGPERRAYEKYLKASGCPSNPQKRKPSEDLWGTDKNIIPRIRGKQVKLGEFLGWTGNTGPIAVKDRGSRTIPHLQVFVCRKNPKTQKWHLIDPYGIYASRNCYPSLVNEISTISCTYATAWFRGKPQYPRLSAGK